MVEEISLKKSPLREFKDYQNHVQRLAGQADGVFTTIPRVRDVFITPQLEGKNMYTNGDYQYVGRHPDFLLYIIQNTKKIPVGSVKGNNRRTRMKYKRIPLESAISVVGFNLISAILQRAVIETCDTAHRIQYSEGRDPIFDMKDMTYKRPFALPGIYANGLLVDADFRKQTGGIFLPYGLGHKNGVPVVNPAGISNDGKAAATAKLFSLSLHNTGDSVEFIMQWDKYMNQIFYHYDISSVSFELPSEGQVFDDEKHRRTSAGWLDLEPVQGAGILRKIEALENDFVNITTRVSPLKSESAGLAVSRIFKALRAAQAIFSEGGVPASGLFGPNRLVTKFKSEIQYLANFFDYADSMEGWDAASTKYLSKLRIFWSDSQIKVLIDRLVLSADFVKGGFDNQVCAIGVSVSDNTFLNLFDRLRLGPKAFPRKLSKLIQKVLRERPHLRKRIYSELDYSKYDSLISHLHILVSSAYLALGAQVADSDFDQKLMEWLASVAATNNAYKFAYLPFLQACFYFIGRVPSGSLTTSVLDSIIQMILRSMFMDEVIDDYLSLPEEEFDIERYKDLVYSRWLLIQALIYGDDRTEGCPDIVYDVLGLHPYAEWVQSKFGWLVKFIKPDVTNGDPRDLFPDSIGTVWFETVGDYVLKVDEILSPTFIKTRSVRVYLDTKYLGIFPYRDTEDIVPKAFNSLSAMTHPIKYLCCLASLGFLSVGNLEAYSIIRKLFYNYLRLCSRTMNNVMSEMSAMQSAFNRDPAVFRNMPNSMRGILMLNLCGDFPSWNSLRRRYRAPKFLEKYNPQSYLDQMSEVGKVHMEYNSFDYSDFEKFFDFSLLTRVSAA
jgi:hypothetical protein